MQTYMANPDTIERKWYVVDAEGCTLGRLASGVASVLRGKNKPQFTPHVDTGDYVIVVNADKIKVTGKKLSLIHISKILILDEPTAGLDPKGRDDILDQIAELHKVRGITIVLVSHSMEDIAKYVEPVSYTHLILIRNLSRSILQTSCSFAVVLLTDWRRSSRQDRIPNPLVSEQRFPRRKTAMWAKF